MTWVLFNADYAWKPKSQVTIAYRAGQRLNVTHDCAEAAIAAGYAVAVKSERKKAKEDDGVEGQT